MRMLFGLADLKHLGPAGRTGAGSSGFLILHGYRLGILHLLLGSTFDTIGLHQNTSFFEYHNKAFTVNCQ